LGTAQAVGIIRNDDTPTSGAVLNIASVSAPEGNGSSSTMSFPVTLSGATNGQPVTVQYITANGTAQDSSDYAATHGTLTFNPGVTSQMINVPIAGDAIQEQDETFSVLLSTPTNASIGQGQAFGTILNDDVVTACSPRPSVVSSVAPNGSGLNVHIEPAPYNTQRPNLLQQVRFGTFQNATVTVNGQPIASGQVLTLPASTLALDLTVSRATPGQPTTVPFTIVDGCGEWPTFVGGGTGAGF